VHPIVSEPHTLHSSKLKKWYVSGGGKSFAIHKPQQLKICCLVFSSPHTTSIVTNLRVSKSKTFNELLREKKERYGMTENEAYIDIIRSSQTTRKLINEKFNLGGDLN